MSFGKVVKVLAKFGIPMGLAVVAAVLVFNYFVMPAFVGHGEEIEVPDVLGLSLMEAGERLVAQEISARDTVYRASTEPEDTVVDMFCPHCHTELMGAVSCSECSERMVPLFVRGGGTVQICPRRGCKGHLLDLV